MANAYSPIWFNTFLLDATPASTGAEIDFLTMNVPMPEYRTILDLCCGTGRHSLVLANLGYSVTGLDNNPYALEVARNQDYQGKVNFVEGDMRDLSPLQEQFSAVLNLWQSFGYFRAEENNEVLRQVHGKLRPGGRLVLDIYNSVFFEAHQGTRTLEVGSRKVIETKYIKDGRLTVHLDYASSVEPDTFEWQLYTPDELCAVVEEVGLRMVTACSGFNESTPPNPGNPRMQFVFEKG